MPSILSSRACAQLPCVFRPTRNVSALAPARYRTEAPFRNYPCLQERGTWHCIHPRRNVAYDRSIRQPQLTCFNHGEVVCGACSERAQRGFASASSTVRVHFIALELGQACYMPVLLSACLLCGRCSSFSPSSFFGPSQRTQDGVTGLMQEPVMFFCKSSRLLC